MQIGRLDHVNVRTANLAGMIEWYGRVLGMPTGPRPDFSFGGAWLYAGEDAAVHLVDVAESPKPGDSLRLEHFALRAKGLGDFVAKLRAEGMAFKPLALEAFGILQINVHDPDGNHIHIDFPLSEADGVDLD